MLTFTIRRLLMAIPTLIFISLIIFLLLDLAPGDPTAQLPLTVPPEVREQIRQSLGLGEPGRSDIGDHDVAGPGMATDGDGHLADRAGPGDQHVLPDQVERQRGVHRVAKRVEDGGHVVGQRVGQRVDVRRGQHDEIGERPVPIHAHARGPPTQVVAPGPAVAAVAAHDVALARHPLAVFEWRLVVAPDPSVDVHSRCQGYGRQPDWAP